MHGQTNMLRWRNVFLLIAVGALVVLVQRSLEKESIQAQEEIVVNSERAYSERLLNPKTDTVCAPGRDSISDQNYGAIERVEPASPSRLPVVILFAVSTLAAIVFQLLGNRAH